MKAHYETNKSQFQTPARVRLRQIVLEKEDDAKRIMDELAQGRTLEVLARKFSIAPESSNGGDTGWLEKGTLEVFDQAFKMNVGTRSKILKSPYGWHIYEVLKKEPEARLSFDAAKAKILTHLMETKSQALFSKWLEEQVRKSSVKRNDAVIRAITVSTRGS
jgi:parvulin-like peptidyl-prolyl isomerase